MIKSTIILALAGLSTFSNAAPTMKKRGSGGKRGLAFGKNQQDKANRFTSSEVSWGYDWEARVGDAPVYDLPGNLEFVPMLHSNTADFTKVFAADVEAAIAAGSKHVISLNEPDECGYGGTCTQLVDAIAAHKQFVQPIAEKHPDIKIGSIAVNNGVGPTSIEAFQGLEYLEKFLAGCDGCRIDFVCVHWFNAANIDEFISYMGQVKDKAGDRPVWLTEWKNNEGYANVEFMQQAMAWMDKPEQSWIARYAWHNVEESLVEGEGLSAAGKAYVAAA